MRIRIGSRTVLAMTCTRCGELKQGHDFERYARKPGERPYYDKRCRNFCRWLHLERSPRVA